MNLTIHWFHRLLSYSTDLVDSIDFIEAFDSLESTDSISSTAIIDSIGPRPATAGQGRPLPAKAGRGRPWPHKVRFCQFQFTSGSPSQLMAKGLAAGSRTSPRPPAHLGTRAASGWCCVKSGQSANGCVLCLFPCIRGTV